LGTATGALILEGSQSSDREGGLERQSNFTTGGMERRAPLNLKREGKNPKDSFT